MTGWSSDRVREAAASWVWVPPGASEARTPDYHLVTYPESLAVPTQVVRCASSRPASAVVEEVCAVARAWGRPDVSFWVGDTTLPSDLAEHLAARGAVHVESVEWLALELTEGAPRAIGLDAVERDGSLLWRGIEVRQVVDASTLHDADLVGIEVWGGQRPEEDVPSRLRRFAENDETMVVAYLDGLPAATGGLAMAGGVARLWGGSTRATCRGRGAYRATLAARLWLASRRGAGLALVKAVTTTSAPILRGLGFTAHGTQDRWRLDLPAPG